MRRRSARPTWRTSPARSNWPATRPRRPRPRPMSIMAFETKLAKASRTLVDLRDPEKNYNKFQRAALGKLAPGLDWDGYFAAIAFPGGEAKLLVRQPEFFTAFGGLLTSEPLPVWRDYLRWRLLSETRQLSEQAVRRGAVRLLRQEALRRDGTAAALEAGAGRGGRRHRRGPGPTLRAEGVQPRRQGPRPDDGGLHQGGHAASGSAPPTG